MEGKVPKKKVEIGEVEGKVPKGGDWGGGGMLKQLALERGKQLLIYSDC